MFGGVLHGLREDLDRRLVGESLLDGLQRVVEHPLALLFLPSHIRQLMNLLANREPCTGSPLSCFLLAVIRPIE